MAKLQTFESPLKQTNNRLMEISGLRVPADASTFTWQVMVRQLGLLRVEKVTALHFSNPHNSQPFPDFVFSRAWIRTQVVGIVEISVTHTSSLLTALTFAFTCQGYLSASPC